MAMVGRDHSSVALKIAAVCVFVTAAGLFAAWGGTLAEEQTGGTTATAAPADGTALAASGFLSAEGAAEGEAAGPRLSRPIQPPTGKDGARMVLGRLDRMTVEINRVFGTAYLTQFGETGEAARSDGSGVITIDFSLVWQLSDDALAALLAHEFAHDHLGHRTQPNRRLRPFRRSNVDPSMRFNEESADELAGSVLAQLGYSENSMEQLLPAVRATDWETESLRQFYPHSERIAAFKRGYAWGKRTPPTTPLPLAERTRIDATLVDPKTQPTSSQGDTR